MIWTSSWASVAAKSVLKVKNTHSMNSEVGTSQILTDHFTAASWFVAVVVVDFVETCWKQYESIILGVSAFVIFHEHCRSLKAPYSPHLPHGGGMSGVKLLVRRWGDKQHSEIGYIDRSNTAQLYTSYQFWINLSSSCEHSTRASEGSLCHRGGKMNTSFYQEHLYFQVNFMSADLCEIYTRDL